MTIFLAKSQFLEKMGFYDKIKNGILTTKYKHAKILIGIEKLNDIFHHQRLVILRKTTAPN